VQEQAAIVTDADKEKILSAYYHFRSTENGLKFPPLFGDGKAAEFICETILGIEPRTHGTGADCHDFL
jgi:hypothetical protein